MTAEEIRKAKRKAKKKKQKAKKAAKAAQEEASGERDVKAEGFGVQGLCDSYRRYGQTHPPSIP